MRNRVGVELDRVAAEFRVVASKQDTAIRATTEAVIALVEHTRAGVIPNKEAGLFIREWQDMSDQVRQIIFSDPSYQAIRCRQSERVTSSADSK